MSTERPRWVPTNEGRPRPGQRVDWIAPSGEQVDGGSYQGGAVWYPPDSPVCVYYTPAFWRPAEGTPDGR